MYPRVKEISGKQYVYLVEGLRSGRKVDQKTVAYLGPLSVVIFGIPSSVRKKVERNSLFPIDWKNVTEKISELPVKFDNFSTSKRRSSALKARLQASQRPLVKSVRKAPRNPSRLFLQREFGELDALTRLSKRSFRSMFEQLGPYEYRFRSQA